MEQKQKIMQTVNFSMPVNLETGHPNHILEAAFLGRAIIENEPSDEFTSDGITASVQDLFFLHDTTLPTAMSVRVELPDPYTAEGRMFRSRLETAAKEAFWALEMEVKDAFFGPALPDEHTPNPGDTVIFPSVTREELAEVGIIGGLASKIIALSGKPAILLGVDNAYIGAPFESGYFTINNPIIPDFAFPLKWLRR